METRDDPMLAAHVVSAGQHMTERRPAQHDGPVRQLELADRPSGMSPVCLVVRAAGGTVCLLADEVGNVVEVEDETFEPSPETLSPRLRSVILGVHKLERQLMHVLDTDQACEIRALGRDEGGGA